MTLIKKKFTGKSLLCGFVKVFNYFENVKKLETKVEKKDILGNLFHQINEDRKKQNASN
ncbi:MAG TPA: hypothetical protein VMW66_03870 [Elusimicrobiales bacterium]|nr:hypothetical protein [Elusimicrobiales bacterium]